MRILLTLLLVSAAASANAVELSCDGKDVSVCETALRTPNLSKSDRYKLQASRARNYQTSSLYSRALEAISEAEKSASSPQEEYYSVTTASYLLNLLGRTDDALAKVDTFLAKYKLGGNDRRALQKSYLLAEKGDFDRAYEIAKYILSENPNDKNVLGVFGSSAKFAGHPQEAIDAFTKRISLTSPSDDTKASRAERAGAYANRGDARRIAGDYVGALDDLLKADTEQSEASFIPMFLGDFYRATGNNSKAIESYSRCLKDDPEHVYALTQLGVIYEDQGKIEFAQSFFSRAIDSRSPNRFLRANRVARALAASHLASLAPTAKVQLTEKLPEIRTSEMKASEVKAGRANKRVALVIGNSGYRSFPSLRNPANDAQDIAQQLRSKGFEVVVGTDMNRIAMEDAFSSFAKKARSSTAALVYFAGHGIQYQGVNYLAPIDGTLTDEADLRKFLRLQDVVSDLQNAPGARILIVDACRDNDAVVQLAKTLPQTRSASLSRGLARVDADGILIAFATQANRVAEDGSGRNSPFTAAFLTRLREPNVEIRTMLTRVRSDVVRSTESRQRPEVWDSLIGEFSFDQ